MLLCLLRVEWEIGRDEKLKKQADVLSDQIVSNNIGLQSE